MLTRKRCEDVWGNMSQMKSENLWASENFDIKRGSSCKKLLYMLFHDIQ